MNERRVLEAIDREALLSLLEELVAVEAQLKFVNLMVL